MSEIEWQERGYPLELICPLTGKVSRPAFVELCGGLDPEDVDPENEEQW